MTWGRRRAEVVQAAVERLDRASQSRTPCLPIRDLIGSQDIALAYAVQEAITARRESSGARLIGRKIGLTSPAVQKQLGVDQPDFGVLFEDMHIDESQPVPIDRLLQPKVEAEIAFVLGEDLSAGELTRERVRGAVEYAVVALEIVDSRIADWDITIADTVADNASSGLFVLGRRRLPLADFDPAAVQMSMTLDGALVSTGDGAACLGDPLNALVWLATTARAFGGPLAAGQIVLSGALGPMVAVGPGASVRAEIRINGTRLGSVAANFTEGDTET